jgi:hypothetical protein
MAIDVAPTTNAAAISTVLTDIHFLPSLSIRPNGRPQCNSASPPRFHAEQNLFRAKTKSSAEEYLSMNKHSCQSVPNKIQG